MNLTSEALTTAAASTGFSEDVVERVLRLLHLLDAIRSHPYLRPRLALKGGTAINLFLFEIPRLSVDIDLNYVGTVERLTMLTERPQVEQAIQAVCQREGLGLRRMPDEHSGGKWRLRYTSVSGRPANLEVDLNFLLRQPLWPVTVMDSNPVGPYQATRVSVLDRHELAGGKLAALLSRTASRDVFDACALLGRPDMDRANLRLAFVVYGGMSRKEWRTVSADDVTMSPIEASAQLLPTLRVAERPEPGEVAEWSQALVSTCRDLLGMLLPLSGEEREFLGRLNDTGTLVPELLTRDPAMQERIRTHPGLLWKAVNVRKHRGLADGQ